MNLLVPRNSKNTIEKYFDNNQNHGKISHDDAGSFVVYYRVTGIACSNGSNYSSREGVILDLESGILDRVTDYKKVLFNIALGRTKVYPVTQNDYQTGTLHFRKSKGVIEDIKAMKFIYDYANALLPFQN